MSFGNHDPGKPRENFTTEGEKQSYCFLEAVAKPDSQYIVWYTPDLKGKEPDFILFGDKIGLIVFEVKDWALEQILEANPQHFILSMGGKTKSEKIHSSRPVITSCM